MYCPWRTVGRDDLFSEEMSHISNKFFLPQFFSDKSFDIINIIPDSHQSHPV